MLVLLAVGTLVLNAVSEAFDKSKMNQMPGSIKMRFDDVCDNVCQDLPIDDRQPVCMMFSRYKRGYQFYVNECHAKRAICKENLVLHMVHPSRCMRSYQFFMPVN